MSDVIQQISKTFWGSESVYLGTFETVLLIFSVLFRNPSARRFGVSKTLLQDGFRAISEKRLANKASNISSLRRQQDGKTVSLSKKGYIHMRAHAHTCGAEFFPEMSKSVLLTAHPSLAVSS